MNKLDHFIASSIEKRTIDLLSVELGISEIFQRCKQEIILDEFIFYPYTASVHLVGDINYNIVMSFSEKFIEEVGSVYIPTGYLEQEVRSMYKELPLELINTVVGHALQDFSKEGYKVSISIPFPRTDTEIKILLSKFDYQMSCYQSTQSSFVCLYINQ